MPSLRFRAVAAVALPAALLGPLFVTAAMPAASASAQTTGIGSCPSGTQAVSPAPVTYAPQPQFSGLGSDGGGGAWAVGSAWNGSTSTPLAEHFDGTTWTVTLPPPGGSLDAVAGSSPNDVWAVGSGGVQAFAEHWNGTGWAAVAMPAAPVPGAAWVGLSAVSADASNDAWAVGSEVTSTAMLPVIDHWDGTTWSATVSAPVVPDAALDAVLAVSPSDAWAVGNETGPGVTTGGGLIEHWDGTAWSVVTDPVAAGEQDSLTAVAPDGGGGVWAVGDVWLAGAVGAGGAGVVDHWDGAEWSSSQVSDGFTAVVASSQDDAWALGSGAAAVLHWDGTQWSVASGPSGPALDMLGAVDTSAGVLSVVSTTPNGPQESMLWQSPSATPSFDALPGVPIPAPSWFRGVSATADGQTAVAVGANLASASPLVQVMTGSSWSNVAVPAPAGGATGSLDAVDALSPTDAWAVGVAQPPNGASTAVTYHETASGWSAIPAPGSDLSAVSADSDTDAWAAGSSSSGAVVDHWNGTSWSETLPNIPGGLNAVDALSPTDVWAAGVSYASPQTPLLLQWNGTVWTTIQTPLSTTTGVFNSIYAASPTSVWVAGGDGAPWLDHWDGTTWTVAQAVIPTGATAGDITSLSGDGAADVWATTASDVADHWNGVSWSALSPAVPMTQTNAVFAAGGAAWAVGENGTEPSWQPAIARLCPQAPTAPAITSATAGTKSITLSWTPPPGFVDGYAILAYDQAAGYIGEATCAACTSYTYAGLAPGHTYAFLLFAHDPSGYGTPAISSAIKVVAPPGAPTATSAVVQGQSVVLSWTAPAGPVDGFAILAYDEAAGYIGEATCTACGTYTYSGLAPGHSYAFLVFAHDSAGYGTPVVSPLVKV